MKEILFNHINCYWYKLLSNARNQDDFGHRILERAKLYMETNQMDPFVVYEGYNIGEELYQSFIKNGNLQLTMNTFYEGLDKKYPGYFQYLESKLHSWAVPLSYRSYISSGLLKHTPLEKELNILGSTKSHTKYFEKLVDRIVRYLVNNSERKPKGFVDIGCGDGFFLSLIKKKIESIFPDHFLYIGVDIDETSRSIAESINGKNISFIYGDVSDPDLLNQKIIELGLPSLDQYFHVRAFVDHNFNPLLHGVKNGHNEANLMDYEYRFGETIISENILNKSYVNHFKLWKKYICNYGIGIIELHKVNEHSFIKSPAFAYEIFHLLSDQFIIDYHRFNELIKSADWVEVETETVPSIGHPMISLGIYH
ncbi:class I SAM-dependent methyltransferase [Sphingobacterium kitahiroshimense]|uniref:Class I SAM-dependent methyltransferase n=1 Tax=Sphingobacterium kitahiroshimense TaxID=470446 RepID=A0ABV0BVK6_9SPHI